MIYLITKVIDFSLYDGGPDIEVLGYCTDSQAAQDQKTEFEREEKLNSLYLPIIIKIQEVPLLGS